MLLTLMIVFLPTLSSCSNKPPEPVVEVVYEKQYIPIGVLKVDCHEQSAGDTVRTLGMSWVNNTSCLRAHERLVDGLIKNYTKEGASRDEHSSKD